MLRSGLVPSAPVARIRRLPARQDVAGRGLGVEMQLDSARFELTEHVCNARLDRRMIRAVAGDEFLDDGPQRHGRQLTVGDAHANSVLCDRGKAK
jgi:hypothetical protein